MRSQGYVWGCRRRFGRRAAVVVQVAVMATMILGFAALAVDVSMLYTAKAELQAAADAAALAGASQLGGAQEGDPEELARLTAQTYAGKHRVAGATVYLEPDNDVELGKSVYNPATGRFMFQAGGSNFDAVRVTVKRTSASANGPIPLLFANIYGASGKDMWASAAAVLTPRDIAVVIDLSNSMCWDSQLRFWNRTDGGCSNLRDVWCALNGPEPSRPYIPGSELETEYAGDTGPTYGAMTQWGNPLIPGTYNATTDPGLWYIPKNSSCTVAAARTSLQTRGYITAEVNALLSGSKDNNYGNQWRNRAGVILGLATWYSGKPGGMGSPNPPVPGDGNDIVKDSEVIWAASPSYARNWDWKDFIQQVRDANPSVFRYRCGLKTLVDYIMENHPESFATDVLWATPEEPLRAIKDAVQTMVNVITSLDSLDHLSLEIFAQTARHQVDLTNDLQSIPDTLYHRQSGHWDRYTNLGGGLQKAIDELKSGRARAAAAKVIVLMSDGQPNVDANDEIVPDGAPGAVNYAYDMADEAADENMRIYAVSVGYYAAREVMQTIATKGHGQEFYAVGSPEEYTEQLEQIFRTLGGRRAVALIE